MSCSEILAQEAVKAQTELGDAEIALLEATARAEVAREAAQRLVAACAALRGEIPVGPSATVVTHGNNPPALDGSPEVHELMKESLSAPVSAERAEAAAMSPEEFDKERRRKQRKREKEEIANNPLGHLKCPGCGEIGHMTEQIITTEKGGVIKALICGKCGNQAIM